MSTPQPPPPVPAATAAAVPAAPVSTGPTNSTQATVSSGSVSSLGELQAQAPQVYNAMMESIAMEICQQMQQQQADLDKIIQEYNEEEWG